MSGFSGRIVSLGIVLWGAAPGNRKMRPGQEMCRVSVSGLGIISVRLCDAMHERYKLQPACPSDALPPDPYQIMMQAWETAIFFSVPPFTVIYRRREMSLIQYPLSIFIS